MRRHIKKNSELYRSIMRAQRDVEEGNILSHEQVFGEKKKKATCKKCKYLMELFQRTPMTYRDYWLMTELFVWLHGGDVCRG